MYTYGLDVADAVVEYGSWDEPVPVGVLVPEPEPVEADDEEIRGTIPEVGIATFLVKSVGTE